MSWRRNDAVAAARDFARTVVDKEGPYRITRRAVLRASGRRDDKRTWRLITHAIHVLQINGVLSRALPHRASCRCGICRQKVYEVRPEHAKRFLATTERFLRGS